MQLIVEMHATSFNLTSIQNFWKMVAHATKMEEGSVPKRVPSEIRHLGYAKNKGKHQKIILVLQLFSKMDKMLRFNKFYLFLYFIDDK